MAKIKVNIRSPTTINLLLFQEIIFVVRPTCGWCFQAIPFPLFMKHCLEIQFVTLSSADILINASDKTGL